MAENEKIHYELTKLIDKDISIISLWKIDSYKSTYIGPLYLTILYWYMHWFLNRIVYILWIEVYYVILII